MFPIDEYLKRIDLGAAPRSNEDGLRSLQRAQFFSIPFENLDILLGRGIQLDQASLIAKLIDRRRGGYCFELNGLLLLALREFGFQARPLLARVHLGGTISGRSHQLSLVELGRRSWIVDAGFGAGGPRNILPLEQGALDKDAGLRLQKDTEWGWLLQSREKDEWVDSYSMDLMPVCDADIGIGNHYTSTSTNSHFTTTRIAGLANSQGRVSLRDDELTRIEGERRVVETVSGSAQLAALLYNEFGLRLSEEDCAQL